MNKNTPLFHTSQLVSSRKNKKGWIKRKHVNVNLYLQPLNGCKPQEISHREGRAIRSHLSTFTDRNIKVGKILLREVIRAKDNLSTVSRYYLRKSAEYKDNKVVSKVICTLESLGLLEVDQHVKKVNHYKLGPLLKDQIVVNYLKSLFPSLRRLLPALFSASLLLSQRPHPERNASQLRMYIYNKKEENFKKNINMKKTDEFSRDFVLGDAVYSSNEKKPPGYMSDNRAHVSPGSVHSIPSYTGSKYISCCTFREMRNVDRRSYMHRYHISHKDSDKGYVPISERMRDMLLCKETCRR
jgi:hypothetical protein